MINDLVLSSIGAEIIGPELSRLNHRFLLANLTIEKSPELHHDVIYFSVVGRETGATARQRLNIHPLTVAQTSSVDQLIELLSSSIQEVIPILEGTLALAGEP